MPLLPELQSARPALTTCRTDLLASYQPDTPFFLTSPHGSLLAQGTRQTFAGTVTGDVGGLMSQWAMDTLSRLPHDPHGPATLVGAIPFDHDERAVLRVPQRLQRSAGLVSVQRSQHRSGMYRKLGEAPRVHENPPPEVYARAVQHALERIGAKALRKVVLSRAFDVELSERIDLRALLGGLVRRNPEGYTFAVELPGDGPADPAERRVLIGASPELLVARRGGQVVANPLAGSVPRSVDAAEDERRRAALLRSDKDLREHAIVVDAVEQALRPLCKELHVPSAPSAIATPTMWHLSTHVTGTPLDNSVSSLRLATALHPTPAVCGEPPEAARALIRQLEPAPRGFFTGAIGWCDAQGDGEWIVAIRCAEVAANRARIYAGAGIVAGSDPDAEVAETAAKLRTMLDAFGLPGC